MRPFLLLSSRAEDLAADEEYAAFLRCTGLSRDGLQRIRLEAAPLPRLDLDDWSGILIGGGPFNSSDPADQKSAVQRRVEADLNALLDDVVARDFPFFGACYGVGTLGAHQGGVVDRTYGEALACVPIEVTDAGSAHVGTQAFRDFVERAPDLVAAQPQIIYVDAADVPGWGPMGEIQPRG